MPSCCLARSPTAFRTNITGILPVPELALWNVEKK
jgi:hypothetical protein